MYVNVSQRFIEAVNYLIDNRRVRNQAELTERLDLSKGYVSQIVNGKREPSEPVVRKFANLYPEISGTWLLTGEGDMLVSAPKNHQVIGSNHGTAINGDGAVIQPQNRGDSYERMLNRLDALIEQNGKLLDIVDRLTAK